MTTQDMRAQNLDNADLSDNQSEGGPAGSNDEAPQSSSSIHDAAQHNQLASVLAQNNIQWDDPTVLSSAALARDAPATYEKRTRTTRRDIRFRMSLFQPKGPMSDKTIENEILKRLCGLQIPNEAQVMARNSNPKKAIKIDRKLVVSARYHTTNASSTYKKRIRRPPQACVLDWKTRLMIANHNTFPRHDSVSGNTLKKDIANLFSHPPMKVNENLQNVQGDGNSIIDTREHIEEEFSSGNQYVGGQDAEFHDMQCPDGFDAPVAESIADWFVKFNVEPDLRSIIEDDTPRLLEAGA